MKNFDLIVFDLDGTLFDTKRSILKSIKHMIETENLRELTDAEVESFLGPPLVSSIEKYFPELSAERKDEIITSYRDYYMNEAVYDTNLYDGMYDNLVRLKKEGYKVALATYKVLSCVTPLFKKFNIIDYFDTLRGSVLGEDYTKSDIIKMAMDDTDVHNVDKICMIGDTEHDFNAAIDCNISFIGMTYGFGYNNISKESEKYEKFLGYCDSAKEIFGKLEKGK